MEGFINRNVGGVLQTSSNPFRRSSSTPTPTPELNQMISQIALGRRGQKPSQKRAGRRSLRAYYLSTVVKSIHSPEAETII